MVVAAVLARAGVRAGGCSGSARVSLRPAGIERQQDEQHGHGPGRAGPGEGRHHVFMPTGAYDQYENGGKMVLPAIPSFTQRFQFE